MEHKRFLELVDAAIKGLPEEFIDRMDNIEILVADLPTSTQMRKAHVRRGNMLLGLYEGVPRTERTSNYGMVLPDKITVFRTSIEAMCHTEEEIEAEVRRVVLHEIAHHFGISDERLDELGM